MMKVHEKLHTNVIRVGNCIRKMNVQEYINKESGKIRHKVWKRGRLKKIVKTTIEKGHEERGDGLHFKVLDPRGFNN